MNIRSRCRECTRLVEFTRQRVHFVGRAFAAPIRRRVLTQGGTGPEFGGGADWPRLPDLVVRGLGAATYNLHAKIPAMWGLCWRTVLC